MSVEIRKIKSGPLYRSTGFELIHAPDGIDAFIDKENRSVTLSFSSAEPVEREFGLEILDHSGAAVDLSRLHTAGPLLVNHDRNDIVGVVETASNDGERCSAVCRFGKSARAEEVFNDVIDGIRRTVSFGYRVTKLTRKRTNDDGIPVYIAEKWQPFEISLETLPADTTVGVGRGKEDNIENEIIVEETREQEIPIVIVKDKNMENGTFETGIKAERKRLSGIRQIADKVRHLLPDVDALVEDFSNSERTLDEFNAAIVAKMDTVQRTNLTARQDEANLGLSAKEKGSYSLVRLVNALESGNWKNAGYELEVSRAQAALLGAEARGAYIPFELLSTRANETTTTTAAGMKETAYWGDGYIDILRAKSVVVAAGAQVLPGLQGLVQIPKTTTASTFSWVAENTAATRSAITVGSLTLTPADIAGEVAFTRAMMKQAGNPGIEAMVRNDLNNGIAVFLDKQCLVGSGTTSGVTYAMAANTTATTATWATTVDLETAVATANADLGALSYICSPTVRGILKQKLTANSGATGFIMDKDGTVNGYNCRVTTNATDGGGAHRLLFGNWNDLLIPMWGGVDITVDNSTLGGSGGVVLRAFLSTAIALRNSGSFAWQGVAN